MKTGRYQVVEAQSFWDCVHSRRRDDGYLGALMDTLVELRSSPFRNPRLHTHVVGEARNGRTVFSSDVGGRRSDRRVIWQLANETIVVLLYGTHAVQERAKRMRIELDPVDRVITVVEVLERDGAERPYHLQRQRMGKLFMRWTDGELEGFGFPASEVAVLRQVDSEQELLDLEGSMSSAHFTTAFNLHVYENPCGEEAARDRFAAEPAPALVMEPEPTAADRELERYLRDPDLGAWFTRIDPQFLPEIMARPIEDWMIYLHPDQRAAATRTLDGPAHVRGAAGTGKTVVGLHRAAWLAEQNRLRGETKPILFTTFVKTLPPVLESLYQRMPGTRRNEVEFVHIDRLANRLCTTAGDRQRLGPKQVTEAFNASYRRIVSAGTPLSNGRFSKNYIRDEITAVIKGRGIESLDDYQQIRRTGRRSPMGVNQRSQVWELMGEWDAEMARRKVVDFPDVVLAARRHARRQTEPKYSAAIIDEAQDISLAGLQLVQALVDAPGSSLPGRRNGLMIIGDGAQRIYTGGFTLAQAGIEVRGRSTILKTNYRNTQEILDAAMAVAGEVEVDDLGDTYRRGEAAVDALRVAAKPVVVQAVDMGDQLDFIVHTIARLTHCARYSAGDIGVLVPSNQLVNRVMARLEAANVGAQSLVKYDGRPNDNVKVGTYHRAKGLEFKAVFLPGLSQGAFPPKPRHKQLDSEIAEDLELALSQLFVAMTRARDALVLLYDGAPSSALSGVTGAFATLSTNRVK